MKRNILLAAVLVICLIGCTDKSEETDAGTPTAPSTESADLQDGADKSADDIDLPNNESSIVNLPDELYQEDKFAYAKQLRHDFRVTEKTEFNITVQVDYGKFSLGIQDKDTKDFVYAMKEFQSETDTVILEKGNFSVIIEKSEYAGNYHITGVPVN